MASGGILGNLMREDKKAVEEAFANIASSAVGASSVGALTVGNLYNTRENTKVSLLSLTREYGVQVCPVEGTMEFGDKFSFDSIKQGYSDFMFLCITMPDFGAHLPAGERVFISQGWAIRCMKQFQLTFPDTNLPSYTIDVDGIFPWLLNQCESFTERQEVVNFLGNTLEFVGGVVDKYTQEERTARLPVFVPWCDLNPKSRVPMDLSILDLPFKVQCHVYDLRQWAQGDGVASNAVTKFSKIEVQNHMLRLGDETAPIGKMIARSAARGQKDGVLTYPFLHPDTIDTLQGRQENGVGIPTESTFTIPINVRGDLTQLDIMLVDGKDLRGNSYRYRGQSLVGLGPKDGVVSVTLSINKQPLFVLVNPEIEMIPIFGFSPVQYVEAKVCPAEYGSNAPLGGKYAVDKVKSTIYPFIFAHEVPGFDQTFYQKTKTFNGQKLSCTVEFTAEAAANFTNGVQCLAVGYYNSMLKSGGDSNAILIGSIDNMN